MADTNGHTRVVDYYTGVVLLAERLDAAFPEFGWRRDARGWIATNEETTHRVLGVRAERVVAHGPAPRGFLVHGDDPVLWTAYSNGGQVPRGAEFVRAVRELAERAAVETAPLERPEPRDRKAELLGRFFDLAQRELISERGASARNYLGFHRPGNRGSPSSVRVRSLSGGSRLGLVPERAGFTGEEIANSGLLADRALVRSALRRLAR